MNSKQRRKANRASPYTKGAWLFGGITPVTVLNAYRPRWLLVRNSTGSIFYGHHRNLIEALP